eukprot:gene12522-8578_t
MGRHAPVAPARGLPKRFCSPPCGAPKNFHRSLLLVPSDCYNRACRLLAWRLMHLYWIRSQQSSSSNKTQGEEKEKGGRRKVQPIYRRTKRHSHLPPQSLAFQEAISILYRLPLASRLGANVAMGRPA